MDESYRIRASWIARDDGPALQNGVVNVVDGRIVDIAARCDESVIDLGDCCITSTFVNAHCHLDLSDFREAIPRQENFAAWLRAVIAHRQTQLESSSNDSLLNRRQSIQIGLRQSAEYNTGSVLDIVSNFQSGMYSDPTLVNIVPFAELIGVSQERESATFQSAEELLRLMPAAGLSPHAPYTTTPALIERAVRLANQNDRPLAMHVAETIEELQWIQQRSGPIAELMSNFLQPQTTQNSFQSIDGLLQQLSSARRTLLVHGNYLNETQLDFLAAHRKRFAVVYCPRTHHMFGHQRHPIVQMLKRSIPVFLGTDSLASNPDLSVLSEARHVHAHFPQLDPKTIWRMITAAPRDFLASTSTDDGLAIGSQARLASIKLPSGQIRDETQLYEYLLTTDNHPNRIPDASSKQ